jgi:hypothetical protein
MFVDSVPSTLWRGELWTWSGPPRPGASTTLLGVFVSGLSVFRGASPVGSPALCYQHSRHEPRGTSTSLLRRSLWNFGKTAVGQAAILWPASPHLMDSACFRERGSAVAGFVEEFRWSVTEVLAFLNSLSCSENLKGEISCKTHVCMGE